MPPPRVPRATYRLQFNRDFTFAQAAELVPYFAELGISHLYASPFLKSRAGSLHGYDIIDHGALNPEIGDEADLAALVAALDRHGMGMILDFVPNHMAVGGADNAWWLDVLEWGRESPFATYFDIGWQAGRREMRGKVLLPFLGDHYGAVLEKGELVPRFDRAEGSISVWYWGHRAPIHPADYASVLASAADARRGSPAGVELKELAAVAKRLPAVDPVSRRRQGQEVKRRLRELTEAHDAIERTLERLAGDVPALHALLEQQAYRLSFWRTAADEVNYRRFFDINDLAALRMEGVELFRLAHRKVFSMLEKGQIHGLRIDHVDGLYNPAEYCRRLQAGAADALGRRGEEQPVWLVVEKILASHERIRRDWPVAGTTGYDFCNQVLGLFVDPDADAAMERVYAGFIGHYVDFETEIYASKKQILTEVMTGELNVLAAELARIAATHWHSRDFTLGALAAALTEVVACFPVYRTYVTAQRVTDLDRRYIDWAVARARKQAPAIDAALFDFLHSVLDTSAARRREAAYDRTAVIDFAMSFQQYTGPLMAKGFEDTALYRYNRLLALNEVGGDPKHFGLSPGTFHRAMRRRRERPQAMLATATHDTKRGEDVRMRLAALSEMPGEWRQHLERWSHLNASFKGELDEGPAPSADDEVFLYQTLLGAWPLSEHPDEEFLERMSAATVKSLREAKRRTSWGRPAPAYEEAVVGFLRRIAETSRHNPFLDDFLPFQRRLAALGMVNGLAQTLIKLTVPGVPDIYQGTELWQLALVDPDNRRPVDWPRRRQVSTELAGKSVADLLTHWVDGAIKLAVIRAALAHRREDPALYRDGLYQSLAVRGERRSNLVAFARLHEGRGVVTVVPRLIARLWAPEAPLPPLGAAWRGAFVEPPKALAGRRYRNLLTGGEVASVERRGQALLPGEQLFAELPVAFLLGV